MNRVGWLLAGWMALRLAWLLWPGDVRSRIEIGPQTTFVAGPLAPDGFVDFAAAVNQHASKGVTSQNNAVVKLMEAYGPNLIPADRRERYFELLGAAPPADEGACLLEDHQFLELPPGTADQASRELLDQFRGEYDIAVEKPWTAEEFPQLARFLEAGEEPLKHIVEATLRTRYYSPIAEPDAELTSVLLFVEQRTRRAARLLLLRAMSRLGSGDVEGAWDDVLACHRLARLAGQSPHVLGVIVAYAIEWMACVAGHAVINSDALTAAQALQCIADLDSLASIASAADVTDFGQRLEAIDAHCRFATAEASGLAETNIPEFLKPMFGNAFDWNLLLQLANEKFDRRVEIMRIDDPWRRAAEFRRLEHELQNTNLPWGSIGYAIIGLQRPISRGMHGVLALTLGGSIENLSEFEMQTIADLRLTRIGFALAVYQREGGSYPDSLNELTPGILPEIPLDPCSGQDFVYQPADDGYVLYSVGPNLTDDNGHGDDDDPRGDDIVLRAGLE